MFTNSRTSSLPSLPPPLPTPQVVKLINYLSDKDLFSSFYQKKLSRRLLADKGTSDEIEKNVLTKLKQAHGPQYTSKMEGMLNDLQLAKDQTVQFSKYKERNEISLPTDLSVTLLTTGAGQIDVLLMDDSFIIDVVD